MRGFGGGNFLARRHAIDGDRDSLNSPTTRETGPPLRRAFSFHHHLFEAFDMYMNSNLAAENGRAAGLEASVDAALGRLFDGETLDPAAAETLFGEIVAGRLPD